MRERGPHGIHVDVVRGRGEHVQAGQVRSRGDGRAAGLPPCGEQVFQPMVGDRLDEDMQQEAVGERRQAFVFGQPVGGADADAQRAAHARMAAAELAFVQQAEQGVQDGRRAEEDFVEEGDVGFRQHPIRVRFDEADTQLAQVDGTEQFGRLGEPSQQVFEIIAPEGFGDPAHDGTLARARGADDQQVFLRHGTQHHQLRQLVAVDQVPGRFTDGLAQALGGFLDGRVHYLQR
jgi:hypothetical protein